MFKKATPILAGMLLIGGGILAGLHLADRPIVHAKDADKERVGTRTGYVNVAEVLKGYDKANQRGSKINQLRQTYLDEVTELRNKMAEINKDFVAEKDPTKKEDLRDRATRLQRKMEDVDRNAQRDIGEASKKAIVDVHNEIMGIIADLAKEKDFDAIEIYPGVSADTPITEPIAQLILQTPASMPVFIKKDLNLTAEVLQRLNKQYPRSTSPAKPVGN